MKYLSIFVCFIFVSFVSCLESNSKTNDKELCKIEIIKRDSLGYKLTLDKFIKYSEIYFFGEEKKKYCYLKAIYESKMDNEVYGNYKYYLDSIQNIYLQNKKIQKEVYNLSLAIRVETLKEKKRRKDILELFNDENIIIYDFL